MRYLLSGFCVGQTKVRKVYTYTRLVKFFYCVYWNDSRGVRERAGPRFVELYALFWLLSLMRWESWEVLSISGKRQCWECPFIILIFHWLWKMRANCQICKVKFNMIKILQAIRSEKTSRCRKFSQSVKEFTLSKISKMDFLLPKVSFSNFFF